MKKRVILFLFAIFLLTSVFADSPRNPITGDSITGEATSAPMNLSILILPGAPSLNIISPENATYLRNTSILLNFSYSNAAFIWYNFDNSANISLNSSLYFNISDGTHNLYLYANSTYGFNATANVTFSVNTTLLIIDYTNYQNPSTKGSSTDFYSYTYEELQNLGNICLEDNRYGKFCFNENINVKEDINPSDGFVGINNNTNLSINHIELNYTNLPNFNKQATIWIYNLNYTNLRIIRNGEVCPSSICTNESYIGGILKFNVTQMGVYSAEEITSGGITPGTGGGGGGGGGEIVLRSNFTLNKDLIKVIVKQGESFRSSVEIINTGNKDLNLSFYVTRLGDFVALDSDSVYLKPGDITKLNLDFFAKEKENPAAYVGRLIVRDELSRITKMISIILEIKERNPIFDVSLEVLPKKVGPGGLLDAKINVTNFGDLNNFDLYFYYAVRDFDGNTLIAKEESILMNKQLNIKREIRLPDDISLGRYVLYTKIYYGNITATSTDSFEVAKRKLSWLWIIFFILLIMLIIILLRRFLFFLLAKRRKKKEQRKVVILSYASRDN